jgi:hypothetical protein
MISNSFTDSNIIEPLMYIYKDYNYVSYIKGLTFIDGYRLFKECKNRIENDMLWDMYLLEAQGGFEGDFEKYKKSKIKPNNLNRTKEEEQRIIEKYKDVRIR